MSGQDEFLKRILSAFKMEAEEIIDSINSAFQFLEGDSLAPDRQKELLENVYRLAHTLKGASRAVDIREIETICQEMESIFSAYKNDEIPFDSGDLNVLRIAIDRVQGILAYSIDGIGQADYNVNSIVIKLQNLLIHKKVGETVYANDKREDAERSKEDQGLQAPVISAATQRSNGATVDNNKAYHDEIEESETIRISTAKLDSILLQVEDMLSIKLSSKQVMHDLMVLVRNYHLWEKRVREVVPDVQYLQDQLDQKKNNGELKRYDKAVANAVRFLLHGNKLAKRTGNALGKMQSFWEEEDFDLNKRIDTLLRDIKNVVTVPFSEVLNLFPKIVHDYSRQNNKNIKLIILGDNIVIDRRILERLKNPLIHLLRNCLDHGIEKPAVRVRKGKEETGFIRINLERTENKRLRFVIEDDGAGINLKKLSMQVKKLPDSAGLDLESKDKLLPFIFKSGISTSDIISEYSGRGLGLAILKKSIDQLDGKIEVETEKDQGTRFIIELPLSLVTFRGIILKVGSAEFVIPTTKVERVIILDENEVQTIENRRIINYNRELVPLADLGDILNIKQDNVPGSQMQVLLLNTGMRQVAVCVDEIIGEQEILSKSFNKHLKRIRNISGATILGSGIVVPILNPYDLVQSVFYDMSLIADGKKKKTASVRRILVVEDSITSRMLMKNILESAGYEVETAFDGVDGYTRLMEGKFDLVISDVDMPRMNGFDMTAKIRNSKIKQNTPVIIVTSLNKSEDLIRGEEAGANGYIVKSNFAQSNLVETIEKLIRE